MKPLAIVTSIVPFLLIIISAILLFQPGFFIVNGEETSFVVAGPGAALLYGFIFVKLAAIAMCIVAFILILKESDKARIFCIIGAGLLFLLVFVIYLLYGVTYDSFKERLTAQFGTAGNFYIIMMTLALASLVGDSYFSYWAGY